MIKTFKVLSAVLSYPTAQMQAAVDEMRAAVTEEALLSQKQQLALFRLLDDFARLDLYELQERFVLLFDRTRSLSLHLFEHVHGESRERGQAMVDLATLYQENGLEISERELPDYLPLFLEFLSTLPLDEARSMLSQPLHIISALSARLKRRKSVYAAPFGALESLAFNAPESEAVQAILEEQEDDPDDFEQLDRLWKDSEVVFGPGTGQNDGCTQRTPSSTTVRVAPPAQLNNPDLSGH